jgi:hypothetical protein
MNLYGYIQRNRRICKGYFWIPKSCWIAHSKESNGLYPRVAYNRNDTNKRKYPCPAEKQEDIRNAFKHFGML